MNVTEAGTSGNTVTGLKGAAAAGWCVSESVFKERVCRIRR